MASLLNNKSSLLREEVSLSLGEGVRVKQNQCPYSGGPAVYEARAMLIPLNGTASYNDHQICFNDSIAWKKPSQIISYKVSVQPNPAKNEAVFRYQLPDDAKGALDIYSSVGNKLATYPVNENSDQLNINTQELSNGIYYYKLHSNENLIGMGKLIIIN